MKCCIVGTFSCNCSDVCYCTDSVLLIVNSLDKLAGRTLIRNQKLSISSDRFISVTKQNAETLCVKPADVARKWFRFANHDIHYVIPLPTNRNLLKAVLLTATFLVIFSW